MSEQGPQTQDEHGETERALRPRIYVASLSDYNDGRLHGQWIDADQTAEALLEEISEMLAGSPMPIAEEWAIHDYEGFGKLALSEYEAVETISRLGQGIAEHGQAFAAWAAYMGTSSEVLEGFEDAYLGEWESVEAYAESVVDDLGLADQLERVVPRGLAPYVSIDYEAMARDLEMSGELISSEKTDGSGVLLFIA